MDISTGLIAKAGAGTAALAATTTTGVIYSDTIAEFLGISKTVDGERIDDQQQNSDFIGKNSLGLPAGFDLPTDGGSPTTITLTSDQLKSINFSEKTTAELTVSGGSITLEIKKIASENEEHKNYTFIFRAQNEDEITISNGTTNIVVLKKDMNLEFKIKEHENKWSLEKAWNDDEIEKRIGLDCRTNGECSLKSGQKLNVMEKDNKKRTDISDLAPTSGAKIKLLKDTKEYNQGLKFSIEGGDITFTGVTSGDVTKLKNGASYEIKFVDSKWFLSQKAPSAKELEAEEINKKLEHLSIPDTCRLKGESDSADCRNLTGNQIKTIKFEGAGAEGLTVTDADKFDLKIKKISGNEDIFGSEKLKFSFSAIPSDATASSGVILKKNTNLEFKIKGSGTNLTLERAWTVTELAKKINLTCPNGGSTDCTFGSPINIYESSDKWITGTKIEGTNLKISFAKDQENHNQGFKFTISGAVTGLNGGDSKPGNSFSQNDLSLGDYEIKKQNVNNGGSNHNWFLSKATATVK